MPKVSYKTKPFTKKKRKKTPAQLAKQKELRNLKRRIRYAEKKGKVFSKEWKQGLSKYTAKELKSFRGKKLEKKQINLPSMQDEIWQRLIDLASQTAFTHLGGKIFLAGMEAFEHKYSKAEMIKRAAVIGAETLDKYIEVFYFDSDQRDEIIDNYKIFSYLFDMSPEEYSLYFNEGEANKAESDYFTPDFYAEDNPFEV